ncbi:hypothetical protein AVDCRST_MAG81-674 [uncultured Synechococcales cyanobacterium]|uniref:Uncharacterized protein n=1 Tax=uncultured Synechococcales cyanobacterium TaxID=1936017 RepID=A0A6J4UUQ6_9CYAN|nr:hypothetical protein AVDCRST_MAG81-674 [uncultured Synechococcales cyanobacterium]
MSVESLLHAQVSLVQVAALCAHHHPALCALVLPLLPQLQKCGRINPRTRPES